jgi:hypothetical protein
MEAAAHLAASFTALAQNGSAYMLLKAHKKWAL